MFSTWNTICMSRHACAHSQLSMCTLSWACAHLSHLHFGMCMLAVEHAHTLIWACAHFSNSHFSMCTLSVEHAHGLQKKHFVFFFVTQRFVFVTQIIVFVTPPKKSWVTKRNGLQKRTFLGYKKKRYCQKHAYGYKNELLGYKNELLWFRLQKRTFGLQKRTFFIFYTKSAFFQKKIIF